MRRALLRWYSKSARDLPWRAASDPYAIWVSEVMLQQTQVETVVPYFERWMARFPTVQALARARPETVLRQWAGLGYYSRARALQRAARAVVSDHGGQLPSDPATLHRLPGIGPYTAGAIASIAFGRPEPIVDGNVVRVLSRLLALRGDPARAPLKSHLWAVARVLVPKASPADFNQALMELGATVCRPRQPACESCPVRGACAAAAADQQDRFPELAQRPAVTRLAEVAALVERRGRWLVVQLPADAPRWAGMWRFPSTRVRASERGRRAAHRALREITGLSATTATSVARLHYSVTRYRIHLEAFQCQAQGRARPLDCAAVRWCAPRQLEALAMPAAQRKIARRLDRKRP